MTPLLESAVKASLILAVALGLMPLLRNAPAACRHWVLAVALTCAAVVPLVALVTPSWRLPLHLASRPPAAAVVAPTAGVETAFTIAGAPGPPDVRSTQPGGALSLAAALRSIWIAGAAIGLLALLGGIGRLSAIASRARRMTEGTWVEWTDRVRREYGIDRPVDLLQSSHPTLLVTWGLLRPKLIVPAAVRGWAPDRVRLVLYHELAHVRRSDWIVQLAAEVLRCVYWFNPLVWLACTRLRRESEQACDDAVLNRGIEGTDFALELVNIARDLKHPPRFTPGVAIARSSHLERRVRAMLDPRLNRGPVSRTARAATLIGLLTVMIPIAGLTASQTTFGTLSGTVVDPMEAALPDVALVMTNVQTKAKYEVRTDRTGRYQFVGLTPGEYVLDASLPGFALLRRTESVAAQNVERNLTMQIGSVQETINVVESGTPRAATPQEVTDELRRKTAPKCGNTPNVGGVPIGGNLRPPLKIKDVHPQYPAALRNSGVEGTVVLQGRLGADGFLHDLKPASSEPPALVDAAIEAAGQWEFAPTLLNCVAVEIPITITVHFRP